ncbi:hypothetical protein BDV28DRAFT_145699 [Aspergillus coremiiformis]|uniref:BTB domain-containing protein n=1 Tax=Aspergillus coremiiformis TaxID=138285 RepID=A0A5N6ZID6_9EURO|nr:hypothetical protein BDV28DRAFT_145699 [Aspergillus coremiiformis]
MSQNTRKFLDLRNITESGKYSDLTLICQGKQFRVHKAVICSQSPVLAAACDGNFQEALSGTIDVTQFDTSTVDCMIQFLYAGEYDCSRAAERTCPADGTMDEDLAQAISGSTMAVMLLPHIHVAAIADYYNVSALKENVNERIAQIFGSHWSSKGFAALVALILRSTTDHGVRETICRAILDHLDELVKDEDIFQVVDMRLAVALLHGLQRNLKCEKESRARVSRTLNTVIDEKGRLECPSCHQWFNL